VNPLSVVEAPTGYFSLKGDLNRNTIPSVSKMFSVKSNKNQIQDIVLDMSAVKHTDTAGLAWLMNILKDTRQLGIKCDLKDIPKTLVNLAKISDVDSFLSVQ
jgi:phospholipid transport system transporter-binding protein